MAEEILHQEEVLNQEGEERIEIDVEDEDLEQLLFDLNDILFIERKKNCKFFFKNFAFLC